MKDEEEIREKIVMLKKRENEYSGKDVPEFVPMSIDYTIRILNWVLEDDQSTLPNFNNLENREENPTLQNIENVNKIEEKMKDNSGDRHE
jgi:hypothetical protein